MTVSVSSLHYPLCNHYLDGVSARCRLLWRGEECVRIVNLRHKEAHPARRGQARALEELTLVGQTLDHLHCLGEVALVWDLDHVAPHALQMPFIKYHCVVDEEGDL